MEPHKPSSGKVEIARLERLTSDEAALIQAYRAAPPDTRYWLVLTASNFASRCQESLTPPQNVYALCDPLRKFPLKK